MTPSYCRVDVVGWLDVADEVSTVLDLFFENDGQWAAAVAARPANAYKFFESNMTGSKDFE